MAEWHHDVPPDSARRDAVEKTPRSLWHSPVYPNGGTKKALASTSMVEKVTRAVLRGVDAVRRRITRADGTGSQKQLRTSTNHKSNSGVPVHRVVHRYGKFGKPL